jgi:hypothetical protein
MDISELPLMKKCLNKSEECEKVGDTVGANYWLEMAVKVEIYYSKQDYKTASEYYKDKHGTT